MVSYRCARGVAAGRLPSAEILPYNGEAVVSSIINILNAASSPGPTQDIDGVSLESLDLLLLVTVLGVKVNTRIKRDAIGEWVLQAGIERIIIRVHQSKGDERLAMFDISKTRPIRDQRHGRQHCRSSCESRNP